MIVIKAAIHKILKITSMFQMSDVKENGSGDKGCDNLNIHQQGDIEMNENNADVHLSNNVSSPSGEQQQQQTSQSSTTTTARAVQNNISIGNVNGVLHIGPSYSATVVHTSSSDTPSNIDDCSASRQKAQLTADQREHIRNCWKSRRSIQEDELLDISRNVGQNWKDVGNALKFNFTKIDRWEKEAEAGAEDNGGAISNAVYRMLYSWVQWKDEKATVGKLAKALYNGNEFDAFDCLKP